MQCNALSVIEHSLEPGIFIPVTVDVEKLHFSTLNKSCFLDSAPWTLGSIILRSAISRRLQDIISGVDLGCQFILILSLLNVVPGTARAHLKSQVDEGILVLFVLDPQFIIWNKLKTL